MLLMSYIVLTLLSVIAISFAYRDNDDYIRKLKHELFVNRRYDKTVIPLRNHKQSINVSISYSLIHIVDVDLPSHSLITDGWVQLQWQDEYLKWNESEYGGIKVLRVPSTEVFLPDIILYNSADYFELNDNQKMTNVLIFSNGNVMWVPPTALKSLCSLDLTNWPMDEHMCFLKFGSWTYDGNIMDLKPEKGDLDLSDNWSNPEWEITYTNVTRRAKYYPCCKEPYPDVTFFMKLKRRSSLYCYTVFIPALVSIMLGLTSFWYPLRSTTRIILNVIGLLILTQLLLYLGVKLGFSSLGQPYAIRYLSLTMLAIGISLIWTTIGVHLTAFKFRPPLMAVKLIAPLTQIISPKAMQETVKLTNGEEVTVDASQSQLTPEIITLAIDKIVFAIFLLTIILLHV